MATFLNHVAVTAGANGNVTETVDPTTTGTVVAGTRFTPTAGRLLVVVFEGAVTSTTPAGWTLPTGGSAINYTGLYVWWRTAAGADTITTTHNGNGSWPTVAHFFEFAAGSTFVASTSASGVGAVGSAGPTLSGLTGTNVVFGAVGQGEISTTTWNQGTELADTSAGVSASTAYTYSLTHISGYTDTSASFTANMSTNSTPTERLVFAVSAVETAGAAPIALRAAGTTLAATVAVTAINPAVPTGATTGDLSILGAGGKPFGVTFTNPSGWTKIGEATNGTVANGVDTGSTKVAAWFDESAAVGAIGNMTIGGSPNTIDAVINTYSKDPAYAWDVTSFTTGGDTADGANFSATGAAGLSVAAGDWVVAICSVNGDIGTVSAVAIGGMSGATLGTTTTRTNHAVTTGNDTRLIVADVPISAGSSSAAPTFTYTNASSQSGTVLWVRLRQVVAPVSATVTIASTSTLGITGAQTVLPGVGMSSTSTLGVAASRTTTATVSLVQSSTLAVTSVLAVLASVLLAQSSTLSVTGTAGQDPDLTGLLFRVKADDLSGADGSAVSAWGTYAAQATTANQPVLRTAVAALNGHQAVDFDGTNDSLLLTGAALDTVRNRSQLSVFVVYKLPNLANSSARTLVSFSSGTNAAANRMNVLHATAGALLPSAGGRRLDADAYGAISGTSALTQDTAGMLSASFNYSTRVVKLYLNSSQIATTSTFQTAGSTSDTASLAAAIGSNPQGGTEFFRGQIAEILVYNYESDALRSSVQTYVQQVYGISAAGTVTATVDLVGSSALSVTALPEHPATVTLAQSSTFGVTAAQTVSAAVPLAQTSSFTVSATRQQFTTVALAQSSTLAVTPSVATSAAIAFASTSALTVTGAQALAVTAAFTSTSTLSVTALVTQPSGVITLAGLSTLSIVPTLVVRSPVVLAQSSTVAVVGSAAGLNSIAMAQSSTLSITAVHVTVAALVLAQSSTLAVTGVRTTSSSVVLAQSSTLSLTALPVHLGVVALTQGSTLTVASIGGQTASVVLTQTSALAVTTAVIRRADVALAGSSTLSLTAVITRTYPVTLTQTSAMTLTAIGTQQAAVLLAQTSSLAVTAGVLVHPAVLLAQDSSLQIVTAQEISAVVLLEQDSSLDVQSLVFGVHAAVLELQGSSALEIVTPEILAILEMVQSSDLTLAAQLTLQAALILAQSSTFTTDGFSEAPPSAVHRKVALSGPHGSSIMVGNPHQAPWKITRPARRSTLVVEGPR